MTTEANGEPIIAAAARGSASGPVSGPATGPDNGPDNDGAKGAASGKHAAKTHRSFFRELPFLVLVAFILALVIKAFLIQAFFIPSGSMERTLLIKDRVLVNKLVYEFRDVHRGEVVVFNGKHTNFQQETVIPPPSGTIQSWLRTVQRALGLGAPGEKDFIKRVIGIPGDQISCCADGHVVVNGQPLNEPYVYQDNKLPFCSAGPGNLAPAYGEGTCHPGGAPYTVPPHMLFVMGDHRGFSSDSRYNGPIATSTVIGRAFVRVWPLSRMGTLPVPATFHSVRGHALPWPLPGPLPLPLPLPLPGPLPLLTPTTVLAFAGAMPITALRWRLRDGRRRRRLRRESESESESAS